MADTITTTSSQAPEWLQPYLKTYMDRAFGVADQPYQQYQGQRVADLNGTQQTAMDAITNRAMNGNPVMNSAQGALQGIAENFLATMKLSIAWLMHLQPDEIGKWLAIMYTVVQLYVLVRDKIVRKRRARRDALSTTSPGDLS